METQLTIRVTACQLSACRQRPCHRPPCYLLRRLPCLQPARPVWHRWDHERHPRLRLSGERLPRDQVSLPQTHSGVSWQKHLHISAMLHVAQPDTHVAMLMLVQATEVGALTSHNILIWRHLILQQRSSGLPLQQCSSEHGTAAHSSPEQLMNSAPACSTYKSVFAGPSAGCSSCFTGS